MTYKIVRIFHRSGTRRVLYRGVSLEVAQLHCSSKETSSNTCTTQQGKRRTRRSGAWMDCYYREE